MAIHEKERNTPVRPGEGKEFVIYCESGVYEVGVYWVYGSGGFFDQTRLVKFYDRDSVFHRDVQAREIVERARE